MNYIYKKRKYEKLKAITIKERETPDYKLVLGSCKLETKDYPFCDISIYSENDNKPTNMEYLLMKKKMVIIRLIK